MGRAATPATRAKAECGPWTPPNSRPDQRTARCVMAGPRCARRRTRRQRSRHSTLAANGEDRRGRPGLCRPAAGGRIRRALRHCRLRHQRRARRRTAPGPATTRSKSTRRNSPPPAHLRCSSDARRPARRATSTSSPCPRPSTRPSAPTSARWRAPAKPSARCSSAATWSSTSPPCIPAAPRKSACRSWSARRVCVFNRDFFVGYSPERINPGDKEHRLTRHPQGDLRLDARGGRFRRRALRLDHRGRHAQGQFAQGRRGGQGDREHPARPQHRPGQRAGRSCSTGSASTRWKCCRRPAPSGTSCRSAPAWSAATASAWIRTT